MASVDKLSAIDENEERVDLIQRAQWLRAAILGANDGLLSTTSLMLGIGAASKYQRDMIIVGLAGAVAGACSMAVGEFVSVSTQRDIEQMCRLQYSERGLPGQAQGPQMNRNFEAGICTSTTNSDISPTVIDEGRTTPVGDVAYEVPAVGSPATYLGRKSQIFSPGRSPMMRVISENLSAKPTEAIKYAQTETETLPNPIKAALASGFAFLCGSFIPLIPTMIVKEGNIRTIAIVVVASIALAVFGAGGAHHGKSSKVWISAARVLVGGWIAMSITYGLLKLFNGEKHAKGSN